MTLVLTGAYRHRVVEYPLDRTLPAPELYTECGIVIHPPYDRVDVEVYDFGMTPTPIDCPGCIRTRLDQLDQVAE